MPPPRWKNIADAVEAEIDRTGDRAGAVASAAEDFVTKPEVVSRAFKCLVYVKRHGNVKDVVASQTNIELLMAIDQIDPSKAQTIRTTVFNGELSYQKIKDILSETKRSQSRMYGLNVKLDTIIDNIIGYYSLLREQKERQVPIDPSWIGSDCVIHFEESSSIPAWNWCCVISPRFSASSLRGRGNSEFFRAILSATALCKCVSVVLADGQESDWLREHLEPVCQRLSVLVVFHWLGKGEIVPIFCNRYVTNMLGIEYPGNTVFPDELMHY